MSSILNIVSSKISGPYTTEEFIWTISIPSDKIFKINSLESPTFNFSHCSWCVRMFPNGVIFSCNKWISLFLVKKNSQSEKCVLFSLAMALNGKELALHHGNHTFKRNEDYCGWGFYIPREEFLKHWSMETRCYYHCLTVNIKLISTVNSKETIKQEILHQNYKDQLLYDKEHDLILKVKDKEFKAHQDVMQFRCPVFKLMLSHDMLERNRGVVEIPDCEPLAFEQFLFYVYTGNVETLDETNVLDLYYIAEKYDMACLKKICSKFIEKCLSAGNVCDIMRLGLTFSDSSLLESGQIYFVFNAKEILVTSQWKSFLEKYPIHANELLSKTINYRPKRKIAET